MRAKMRNMSLRMASDEITYVAEPITVIDRYAKKAILKVNR